MPKRRVVDLPPVTTPSQVFDPDVAVVEGSEPVAMIPNPNYTVAADVQSRLIHRGGVIRIGTSIYIHDNGAHASVGLLGHEIIDGRLRVYFDQGPGEEVMAVIAEEDEKIGRLGVSCGGSGGNTYVNIMLYKAGVEVRADDPMFGTNANIWLHVVHLAIA